MPSAIIAHYLHVPLTNRFLRVNGKQPVCLVSFCYNETVILFLLHQRLFASRRLFQPRITHLMRTKPFRLLAILREILHHQSRGQKLEVTLI